VGEAPGAEEEEAGRPFMGKSGELLNNALRQAGLRREQFNITNVCPLRPPGNKIEPWLKKKDPRLMEGVDALKRFIEETRPEAILCVGGTALWALTGHTGILSRRGTPESYQEIPTIYTVHPAAVLRDYTLQPLFLHDIRRFHGHTSGGYPVLRRRLVITPSLDDVAEAERLLQAADVVAVDIENDEGRMTCCGFSPSPDYAICLEGDRKPEIQRLLNACKAVLFHNAPYDVPYLIDREGMQVPSDIHDTLILHRTLYPELMAGLDTLCSLYTNEPYYKDQLATWKEQGTYSILYRYNCMDCAVTIESFRALMPQAERLGLSTVYGRRRKMLPYSNTISMRGIRYDVERAKVVDARNRTSKRRWQAILDGRARKPINVFSKTDVPDLLYNDLRLPVQKLKGKVTTGQKKLMHLYATIPDRKIRKVLRAILQTRSARKFESSYLKVKLSPEGRVRSSFNPCGTETGRWSASKYLITEGVNLQTPPPIWRECLAADEGMVMWYADYSQIEARFVAYDAGDERMIHVFESGGDIHKDNASRIYGLPVEQVTDRLRQVAKTCVHALNYDILPKELMLTVNRKALETGLWISLDDAKRIRNLYLDKFDALVAWQQRQWDLVRLPKRAKDRILTNPFGACMVFLGPTTGPGAEHTKKSAIAFVPQSTVPELMNIAMTRLMDSPPARGFEVLNQLHDAMLGQAPVESVAEWAPAIRAAMDIPVTFGSRICRVPVEIKIGPNFKEMVKI